MSEDAVSPPNNTMLVAGCRFFEGRPSISGINRCFYRKQALRVVHLRTPDKAVGNGKWFIVFDDVSLVPT
jgi:hypothetical protein